MSQTATQTANQERGKLWQYIASIGPGVVLLMSTIGPRDLISGVAAGSNYGYGLIWTLVLIGVARFVLLEAIARYVVATGETLLAGYRRIGVWAAWTILASIVLNRYFSNLYHVLLLGVSAGMLIGWNVPLVTSTTAIAACALAFWLMYGGYRGVEKWSKPLAAVLGGSLFLVAAASRPDPRAMAQGLLMPSIPASEGSFGSMFILLVLVGSGLGSISSLKYSAFVFAKGWRDPSFLGRQRFDLVSSVVGAFLLTALIQIAAAPLQSAGVHLESFEDLIAMFTETLGATGRIVLCVGLWSTVFTTYVGSNTGYSLLAADLIVRRGRNHDPAAAALFESRRQKIYRAFLIAFCLPPMSVLVTNWKPVPLVLFSAALSAATLPIVVILLFLLTRNRKLMGDYTNGIWTNLALVSITGLSLVVTWHAVREFIHHFL